MFCLMLILVVVVVSENKQKSPFSYLVGSYFETNWSPQNQNNAGRRTGRSSRRTPRTSLGKSSSPSGSGPCLYLDPGATGPSRRGSGQRVRGWPMGWPGGLGGAFGASGLEIGLGMACSSAKGRHGGDESESSCRKNQDGPLSLSMSVTGIPK